jgi:GPH family glycoside/pentoside/hexuronide:cation symporter
MSLASLGIILSYAVTLPLVRALGGGAGGWQRAFMLFGALGSALILVCFAATRERVTAATHVAAAVPAKAAFAALLRNPHWLMMVAFGGLTFASLGLYGDNIYFCRYFLHNEGLVGPLMTLMTGAQVAGMMFTPAIARRFGKRNSAIGGTFIAIVGQLVLFTAPASSTVIFAGTAIKALGMSPAVGTMFAMIADTVDWGEWRFGIRTDGLCFGLLGLVLKSSIGLGNVLVSWVLALGGYVGGAAAQSASALLAIKALFLHIPLALVLLTLGILFLYRLDGQYPAIREELERRRAQG